ncbi:MAG: hypothetical protein WC150_08685 [Bacteroidia bacterium]
MTRTLLFTCALALLFCIDAQARDKNILLLHPVAVKNLPFSSVSVSDIRAIRTDLGFTHSGIFNRIRIMNFSQPLAKELQQFHNNVLSNPVRQNKLLIAVKQLFVHEKIGAFREHGYFAFAAVYFMSTDTDSLRYEKIMEVDTIFECKGGEVTEKLISSVSTGMAAILSLAGEKAIHRLPAQRTYSYDEAADLINTEKKLIPLYNLTGPPARGIYKDFTALKNNTPTETALEIDTVSSRSKLFLRPAVNEGKSKKIEPGTVYAVCDGTTLYISTDKGFYKLRKEKSDFVFIGRSSKLSINSSPNIAVMAGAMAGGLVGGIVMGSIVNSESPVLCKFLVDPLSGNLIFIETKEPTDW